MLRVDRSAAPFIQIISDELATFSRVTGYVKMISRKRLQVDQDGYYSGEFNFWSQSRRFDWNTRKRLKEEVIGVISSLS
ncbi:hypothetical protein [Cohnella cholangitidis]|uniref:hypothetical protein n=1 Tax=Cohnella cholangitidis TaxID=2598458 RepID=UPI0015FA8DD5|nr:hypothetical protein [Cohnella cholangitidis]